MYSRAVIVPSAVDARPDVHELRHPVVVPAVVVLAAELDAHRPAASCDRTAAAVPASNRPGLPPKLPAPSTQRTRTASCGSPRTAASFSCSSQVVCALE